MANRTTSNRFCKCGVALALSCLFLFPSEKAHAHGGIIKNTFKLAGFIAKSAVRSVPTIVNVSVKTAEMTANTASYADSKASQVEDYAACRVAGKYGDEAVKLAGGPSQMRFNAATNTVIEVGNIASGKTTLAKMAEGTVSTAARSFMRKR